MLIRSLALVTLFAAAVGPALAADSDDPLAQDRGHSRPLIVIAPTSVDKDYVNFKKALDEPTNRAAFNERNMVLYTVINLIGQRDGKNLDAQTTMALIRQMKLGAGGGTKFILVGKDGEKKIDKSGPVDLKDIFSTIDQMPMREKESSAPAVSPAPAAAAPDAPAAQSAKPAKAAKGAKAPPAPAKSLDD